MRQNLVSCSVLLTETISADLYDRVLKRVPERQWVAAREAAYYGTGDVVRPIIFEIHARMRAMMARRW